VSQRRVDWTRQMARRLMEKAHPDIEIAFELVAEGAEEAMGASPAGPDLRGWQSLVTDLASALRPHDADLAERASLLAGRLRSLVGLMARAPVQRLAVRPTSRRVLAAILELGGTDCTLANVRKRTGLSPSHMSNVVRALSAHGLIEVEADIRDGRGRRLMVTSAGRTAIGRADVRRGERFDSYLSDEPARRQRVESARSYEPGLLADDRLEAAA
jgi:DNA-binding MarR family transcriptional regulator